MAYTEKQWISIIAPLAVAEYKRQEAIGTGRGYLPSVLISQTICETGYGNNSGLMPYYNIIGMKSSLLNGTWDSVWDGTSVNYDTIEEYTPGVITHITDAFRVYKSFEECLRDYVQFMNGQKYSGVCAIKDPEQLITAVSKKGYATASTYVKSVMSIISKHNLTQYDREAIGHMTENDLVIIDKKSYTNADGVANIKRGNSHINTIIHYQGYNKLAQKNSENGNWNLFHYKAGDSGLFGGHTSQGTNGVFTERVPEDGIIYHVGSGAVGNSNSFGIECCANNDAYPDTLWVDANDPHWYFTQEQQEALVFYVRKKWKEWGMPLTKENIDAHLFRHYDVTGKTCPAPYVSSIGYKSNWTWEQFKEAVRTGICPNGSSFENSIKDVQEKFFQIGFDCGCKEDEEGQLVADGDWGKGSKSDCLDFCTLFGINPQVNTPTDEVMKKLDDVIQYLNEYVYDPDFYRKKYKDLAKMSNAQLAQHWYASGIKEGRQASVFLDLKYYRDKYPTDEAFQKLSNAQLVLHFIKSGMKEGRTASKDFSPKYYRANYADLKEAFGNDWKQYFKHYLKFVLSGKEKRVANKKLKK